MQRNLLPIIAELCRYSGFNRFCRPMYGGLGLILMFHRFIDDPEKRIDASGTISGAFLDRLIRYIRAGGPEIIPLREVPRAIAEEREFVCLTIDDGYRCNTEIALPIFRRHHVPATIFVPSGVLDRSLDAWWLQIEEMARTAENPQETYDDMVAEVSRDPEALEQLRQSFPVDQEELNERYFMSAVEVKALDQDPFIEIGGHTVSHPFLKRLTDDEAYKEIVQNKKDLESLLDRPVDVFAYPYGSAQACGGREFMLAKKAGYKLAVTTRDGNVMPEHKDYMTALPRYSVRGHFESLGVYDMQKYGTYRALKSRMGEALVTE